MKKFKAIGLMSGSSRDGLDIALVEFSKGDNWSYELLEAATMPLKEWEEKLNISGKQPKEVLQDLDSSFGVFLGENVIEFCDKYSIRDLDCIASHGHTVFHYPEEGVTCQIGDGQTLADLSKSVVVNNLRQKDIDLGGNGAPIVPIADVHLFQAFKYCLNLGGIANISVKKEEVLAFDICPANQVLNHYAQLLGMEFDDRGSTAKKGTIDLALVAVLEQMSFFRKNYPKSLDNEYSKEIITCINNNGLNAESALATYTYFIAKEINKWIVSNDIEEQCLVTGGGAFNAHLINQLNAFDKVKFVVPDVETVSYKEAIAMAFIGVLRLENEVNCLKSVTGASADSSAGSIYYPKFEL